MAAVSLLIAVLLKQSAAVNTCVGTHTVDIQRENYTTGKSEDVAAAAPPLEPHEGRLDPRLAAQDEQAVERSGTVFNAAAVRATLGVLGDVSCRTPFALRTS